MTFRSPPELKDDPNTIVLSVYFSGTGLFTGLSDQENREDSDTISSALFRCSEHKENQISHGFLGCGIVGGFLGGIYGAGINGQVRSVENLVHNINKNHPGKKIILNMYGHSRGGITAILAAKALGNVTAFKLDINMALLDPVPGNFGITQALDPADCTLADQAIDLSNCANLKNVLRLYPYGGGIIMPLMAHTPLVSTFPKDCTVTEDVITGIHVDTENLKFKREQGRIKKSDKNGKLIEEVVYDYPYRIQAIAALDLVTRFMQKYGTRYEADTEWRTIRKTALTDELLLNYYNEIVTHKRIKASSKPTHSKESVEIVAVPGRRWVNEHHKQIYLRAHPEEDENSISKEPAILALEKGSLLEKLNRVTWKRVFIATAKWLVIAAVVAVTLYFTGGLAAIPYIAPLVAKMGAWAIAAATVTMAPLIKLACKNWKSLLKGAALAALIYFTGGLAAIPYIAPVAAQLGAWSIAVLAPVMAPAAELAIAIYNRTLKHAVKWVGDKISRCVMKSRPDDNGYTGSDIANDKKAVQFSTFLSTYAELVSSNIGPNGREQKALSPTAALQRGSFAFVRDTPYLTNLHAGSVPRNRDEDDSEDDLDYSSDDEPNNEHKKAEYPGSRQFRGS